MVQISIVLLTLPDGRIVFQRRGVSAPISPKSLGFFGGHVEPDETFEAAMCRELSEETSLDVTMLKLSHLADYGLFIKDRRHVEYHLYQANLPDMNFKIYEGDRAEAYSKEEAFARSDLTPSAVHVLTNILEGK